MKNKVCPMLLYVGESFNSSFYYYTGIEVTNAFLLIDKGEKHLFVHEMDVGLTKGFKGKITVGKHLIELVIEHIKGRCLYIDKTLPYGIVSMLEDNVRVIDGSEIIRKKRIRKTKKEISNIRRAVKETIDLIYSLDVWGKSEREVMDEIYYKTYERGFRPAFDPIVATGKNAGVPHHKAGRSKVKGMALIDYGIEYRHYKADITRCLFEKEGKSKKMYERIRNMAYEIIDEIPNMTTAKELAEFSEKAYAKRNMKKLIHLIGHGIGLDVHERPLLSKLSQDKLDGAVVAIEPGYYSKTFGVRFEMDVHIHKRNVSILEK